MTRRTWMNFVAAILMVLALLVGIAPETAFGGQPGAGRPGSRGNEEAAGTQKPSGTGATSEKADQAAELKLEDVPPVVVKCVPEAGSDDVDPALKEVRVTFSKPMTDKSWSWSTVSKSSFPTVTGEIHYLADGRTCVLPVKLEPGRTYASWINSSQFRNFKDRKGQPAIPYLLVFRTRP